SRRGAPRRPPAGVAVVQLADPAVGHPLAGLPGARLVEVGAGLPLRAPDPAKHFQGLIGLAAHPLLLPAALLTQLDCSSSPRSQRAPINRSLIRRPARPTTAARARRHVPGPRSWSCRGQSPVK